MSGRPTVPALVSNEDAAVRFRPAAVLAVGAAAAVAALAPLGLGAEAHGTLVIVVAVAGLWITEALPVAVVALLVPVLGLALGVADAKAAFAGFGDPIVFLFFGTFLLTDAAQEHGLNDRLARAVLTSDWVRARPSRLLWAVACLGFLISAWVNNTATTAMLLPLALTVTRFGAPRLVASVMLATAWAPSLGGLATPVGTAPNLIGLRLLEQVTGARPSFAEWCAVFAPLSVISILLATAWLAWRARGSDAQAAAPAGGGPEHAAHRPWSLAERTLVPLFVCVVLLWIGPGIVAATPAGSAAWVKVWQARLPEPAVPLLGALALFLLPARARAAGEGAAPRILEPGVLRRVDWSTILLFGGGLSLGAMMFDSGLARALGEGIFRAMPVHGPFGLVLAAALMGVLVSEMTSNVASTTLVVPVVLALAQAAGVDPVKPALAATVGCSFGFMLPVSTPPNALVYGTGRVTMREMIVNGVLLDAVGVLLVAGWVYWFA